MNFNQLRDTLRSYKDGIFGSGATVGDINKAEHVLGVRFPNSYNAFLMEFGWGGIRPIVLYGLGADIPDYLDLVQVTLSEREDMEPALHKHLVPLLNDGFGNHYCLDTSKMSEGECPVVFWDHEEDEEQEPEIVSESFVEWFADEIENSEG